MTRATKAILAILLTTSTPVLAQQAQSCPELNDVAAYDGDPHFAPLSVTPSGHILRRSAFHEVSQFSNTETVLLNKFVSRIRDRGTVLAMLVPPPRGVSLLNETDFNSAEADRDDRQNQASWSEIAASYDLIIQELVNSGVVAPNLLDHYLAHNGPDALYLSNNTHWTPTGAWVAAQALRSELSSVVALPELNSEFEVVTTDQIDIDGNLSSVVDTICGTQTGPETVPANRVALQSGGDLFAAAPSGIDVVLTGSSYSNGGGVDRFFAGDALSYNLQTQISNRGVMAGVSLTSIEAYLSNTTELPDVLIWEFTPEMIGGMNEGFWRQLLGATYGECDPTHWATITRTSTIPADGTINARSMGWGLQNVMQITVDGEPVPAIDYSIEVDGEYVKLSMSRILDRYPSEQLPDYYRTYLGGVNGSNPTGVTLLFSPEMSGRNIQLTGCRLP